MSPRPEIVAYRATSKAVFSLLRIDRTVRSFLEVPEGGDPVEEAPVQ